MYDLPKDILDTIQRKDVTVSQDLTGHFVDIDEREQNTTVIIDQPTSNTGSKSCSLCGVAFQTVEDQRSHIRSDLHNYNLKQKLRGVKPVSETEFETLIGGKRSHQITKGNF